MRVRSCLAANRGSQHMFNESQTSNAPVNSSGMVNGNANNNTSSSGSTTGANGRGSPAAGATAATTSTHTADANTNSKSEYNMVSILFFSLSIFFSLSELFY